MEFFKKGKSVKLRSHLEKYLTADDDGEAVRQSRNASKSATWTVEMVEHKSDLIRLRSCRGKYLTASDSPFLLGMTGKKVIQSAGDSAGLSDPRVEWQPERDGFQVRLKSWCGKYLRGNGGTPPWRNSVTHDEPHSGSTKSWVLWDVLESRDELAGKEESLSEYLSSLSGLSSVSDEVLTELGSPVSVMSPKLVVSSPRRFPSPKFSFKRKESSNSKLSKPSPETIAGVFIGEESRRRGMEIFQNAKAVRLKSHHDKYLVAEEDESSVSQDRDGSSKNAKWTVEPVQGSESALRFKSCYGKYLTASNQPFLLGMTGRRVNQTSPRRLDSSLEWEPVSDSGAGAGLVRFRTRYGHFLRANGGLPPWRNSVTHDIPHRTSTQEWILWSVDVIEIEVRPREQDDGGHGRVKPKVEELSHSDSLDFGSSSPTSLSIKSSNFSRQESSDSYVPSPPKLEGRTIYYHIAEDDGDVDDEAVQGSSFSFGGNSVAELTRKFEEETGIKDIVMCTRSPLNGKLYPLRLQLPPNNVTMQVVVVLSNSKAAEEFRAQGLL